MHEFDGAVIGPTRTAITAVISYDAMVENFWLAANDSVERFERARPAIISRLSKLLDVVEKELKRVIGPPIG
jgi:hypothetical protein